VGWLRDWIAGADRLLDGVAGSWQDIAGAASQADLPLLALWLAATALLLTTLALTYRRLSRTVSGWPIRRLHGHPVRVSENVGPAVLGIRRGQVVLPRWAAECRPDHRRLIVLHEVEHLRAGDERLLVAAAVIVALVPWNVFAWWQLRRLRLAVELDCDRRVLRTGVQVRQYASLLLDAGSRRGMSPMAAAAFVHFQSQLGRRIREMTEKRKGPRYVPAALATVGAIALVVAACEAPAPTNPAAVQELEEGKALSHFSMGDAEQLHRILEEEEPVALVVEEADGDRYVVDRIKLAEIREKGQAGIMLEKLRQHGDAAELTFTLVHEDGSESGSFGLRAESADPAHNVTLKAEPAEYRFSSEATSTMSPRSKAEVARIQRLKLRQATERETVGKTEGGNR
jgi:beta-lactamase regulating signal transducer with metallopeptidase domain